MNIVIGMTGASGVIYGIRLLEVLHAYSDVTTHLIMSRYAEENTVLETTYEVERIKEMADCLYENSDLGARIASGSYLTDATVIVPCSMKTLGSIAGGICDTLIARAADVAIKEGRKLVLCPRETPLSAIHLENMLKLARLGVMLIPPMPAFYSKPLAIEDLVNHHVMKICDALGLKYDKGIRWGTK
jgi:polyprenyl P-hydroxybenzoate/phenylacrylic acid decarboxylase-like protein